jgi:membrane-bound metal-dependent hydrolase YbcI (DUF457 family)
MNTITHALTGWCLAESIPGLSGRGRALVTLATVAPDLDALGAIAEMATQHSRNPLFWWTDYHHILCHNLAFAVVIGVASALLADGRRLLVGTLGFLAVHLHILEDIAGSRGPDGYQWPIAYLYPMANGPQLVWSGQWTFNGWPNVAITLVLLAVVTVLAWRRGYSLVGLVSRRSDRAFVQALRLRFGEPR